ncbi:MAG: hypothetical protein AAGJ87_17325, partial [Pseudomonadota bacterium]
SARRTALQTFARCWPSQTTSSIPLRRPEPRVARFLAREASAPMAMAGAEFDDTVVVTGARLAKREDLGDYKLYRTPEPTTVAAQQTKQVLFLQNPAVDVETVHVFDRATPYAFTGGDDRVQSAEIEYRIDNSSTGALGEPLPKGVFRVMTKRGDGGAFFLGEDEKQDMAVNAPVKINAGRSPDVTLTSAIRSETDRDVGDRTDYAVTVEHRFTNAGPAPIVVEYTLGKDGANAYRIDRATKRRLRGEAIPTWRFRLGAESETTLSFRARWSES